MEIKPTMPSTSIWGAAYAMIKGAKLLSISPRDRHHPRCAFILDNVGNVAPDALDEFYRGNPAVPIRDLIRADSRAD